MKCSHCQYFVRFNFAKIIDISQWKKTDFIISTKTQVTVLKGVSHNTYVEEN